MEDNIEKYRVTKGYQISGELRHSYEIQRLLLDNVLLKCICVNNFFLTVLLNGDANYYNDCHAYADNKDIYDVSQ